MKRTVTKRTQNLGVNALARDCDLPQSTVSSMMKRGMSADQIRAAAAIRHGAKKPAAKKPAAKQPQLGEYELLMQTRDRVDAMEQMKFRRAKALAERQEIENMLRRGELLPVSYVRHWASRLLIESRDEFLRTPSELADTLAAETDPVKVAAILRTAQERSLAKLEQLDEIWRGGLEAQRVA